MGISAAWLLTIFLVAIATVTESATIQTSTTSKTVPSSSSTTEFLRFNEINGTTIKSVKTTSKSNLVDDARPFTKDLLMREIRNLDEDYLNTLKEVEKTFKAVAQRDRANVQIKTTVRPTKSTTEKDDSSAEGEGFKKFEDMIYMDDLSDEENEDDEDMTDDELDEDEEQVMLLCPDYCKCVGQYAAAMTTTCTKLVDEQSFGPGVAHLRIENAGEIRLGPNALRARGLQQLETITISDTRIVELDRTAFNGIPYLFAVNLTRNGLQDIHPNTFQNNTQLSLLTIAGNPLKYMQDSKSMKHYLLHAPSVIDFDFSNNGILQLKRTAFSKMHSLAYINLRDNRLREIDSAVFDLLDLLMKLDLSDNLLNELPIDSLDDKNVQILHVAGNNLSSLASISASKLTMLDASRNKIKVIAKEDLNGVPLLVQLHIKSNNLKSIHQHAFSNLNQLTYLDMSDNKLSLLTEYHFRANPRLQVLLMNDNPGLQTLPVFKVTGLEYDTFSTFHFECANCGLDSLEPGTFDEMPALTRLILARNRLSALPEGLLDHSSTLQALDLSDNIISVLQPGMFRGAQSLNKLNLARNPLRTLQVTPFLNTPGLAKLDVSRCNLERVWSEARVPLKSLRFLSVRGNLLRRITVEELRATPELTALDLSHNPLDCDTEFNETVQWLTDNAVSPTEIHRYAIDFFNTDNNTDSTGISQWTDLTKIVCNGIEDSPPLRIAPSRSTQAPKDVLSGFEVPEDFDSVRNELKKVEVWLISGTILFVLVILLVACIACCLANKRGCGSVLRPSLILRQDLVDNKNCDLVYKEEIATPHMPKRGSDYSSSTFHYDKIVPESLV